jgi:hypothetical protein
MTRGILLGGIVAFVIVGCSASDGSSGGVPSGGGGGAAGSSTGGVSTGGQAGAASGGLAGTPAGGGSGGTGATGVGGFSGGANCLPTLDQLGVPYTNTVAKGVVDAVHLNGPLNGILFSNGEDDEPMGDPIACDFILRLWQFAEVLKARDFVKVGTLGSYCYRCCCYWSEENYCRGPNDPEPDCSQPPWNGFSTHSWGRALDVRWLYKSNGTVFDINDPTHWVESGGDTCGTALGQQTGISQELYSLVCELSDKHVFGTILTPNYNSVHRNHFHADIGEAGEPGSYYVNSLWGSAVDWSDKGDD